MSGSVLVLDGLARTIARVSLLAIFVVFTAYTVAYVVLLVRHRIPAWTSVAAFRESRKQPWFRVFTFCQVCALATPLLFLAFAASIGAAAAASAGAPDAAPALIATAAATAFALLSTVYYFVQLWLAATDVSRTGEESLSHLFQLNPAAAFTCVNILGWTLFFAVASLCLAPLFRGSAGLDLLCGLLLANGLFCLAGLWGFLWRVRVLNVVFFNGMGLAVLGFSLSGFLFL
jgi:hypothetical protein